MKTGAKPVRSTIVYGLMCGIGFIPMVTMLLVWMPLSISVQMSGWLFLAGYCLLLARWGDTSPAALIFPLLITAALMIIGNALPTHPIFFLVLAVFGWIRSGICMGQPPLTGLIKETLIGCGSVFLLFYLTPTSMLSQAIAIWLFFLIQSLYFLFTLDTETSNDAPMAVDAFEHSRRQAEHILDE